MSVSSGDLAMDGAHWLVAMQGLLLLGVLLPLIAVLATRGRFAATRRPRAEQARRAPAQPSGTAHSSTVPPQSPGARSSRPLRATAR